MSIHWSIVLAKVNLVALYFCLLWYHSILNSIDQKYAKTNEICRQNSEIHPAFACSRWPPWFPDLSRPYGACVKRGGGKHMLGLSLFRPSRQSKSPRRAKKDSNIPSPENVLKVNSWHTWLRMINKADITPTKQTVSFCSKYLKIPAFKADSPF